MSGEQVNADAFDHEVMDTFYAVFQGAVALGGNESRLIACMSQVLGERIACLQDRADHEPELYFNKEAIVAGFKPSDAPIIDMAILNIRDGFRRHLEKHNKGRARIASEGTKLADEVLQNVCESHKSNKEG